MNDEPGRQLTAGNATGPGACLTATLDISKSESRI